MPCRMRRHAAPTKPSTAVAFVAHTIDAGPASNAYSPSARTQTPVAAAATFTQHTATILSWPRRTPLSQLYSSHAGIPAAKTSTRSSYLPWKSKFASWCLTTEKVVAVTTPITAPAARNVLTTLWSECFRLPTKYTPEVVRPKSVATIAAMLRRASSPASPLPVGPRDLATSIAEICAARSSIPSAKNLARAFTVRLGLAWLPAED